MNTELSKVFDRYGLAIKQKDVKTTIEFIYPKLFEFIPKKTMQEGLDYAYNNFSDKVNFTEFKLATIGLQMQINSIEYVFCVSSNKLITKYPVVLDIYAANEDSLDIEFAFEVMKEKYGEDRVWINMEERSILVHASNQILAIREGLQWYLMELKPSMHSLYAKLFPAQVVEEITRILPEDTEEELDDDFEEGERIKVNTVSDFSGDPSKEVIYLAGWEVLLNGNQECEDFIATQITTKETFEYLNSGLELVFKNGKLHQAFEYSYGIKEKRVLRADEALLKQTDNPKNAILVFRGSKDGPHQLGGEVPVGFKFPPNNCMVPFQYLGYINNTDPNFTWLPFNLHLTCPIYLNIGMVFLDYSNPLHPVLLNREEVESADCSYKELKKDSQIVFEEKLFTFAEDLEFRSPAHSGLPNWIQGPTIPRCPKSGQRMKFLVQMNGGVEVKRSNVKAKRSRYGNPFEELHFWEDGDLFVFFEPTSKVACYFIQNT